MKASYSKSQGGYTLVELLVVMVVIAILAAVAIESLGGAVETARFEETRTEMDQLAYAIAGNPGLISGGVRTDYGYLGDIGSLPPDWDALVTNPGYATWDGPYVHDEFSGGGADMEFKLDGWGREYSTPNALTFSSTGGTETVTRQLANTMADLLYNSVAASVVDLDFSPPGNIYNDSVVVRLTYPDGGGSYVTINRNPSPDGFVQFDSVPIGLHTLQMAYLPDNDTLRRRANVDPGQDYYTQIQYYANVWKAIGGELEFVTGSDSLTAVHCYKLLFWIENNTGNPVTITSMNISWDSPTAYFENVYWNDVSVRSGNPALGSGDDAVFSAPQTLNDGESVQIRLERFHRNSNGGGPPVDMTGADFTIQLSDDSVINFIADFCAG